MNTYEHLFTPIKIGNTTVKNRIFMPPLSTNLADKGYVTDALVKHYAARAKGGVGLIVTEVTTVEPTYTYLPGDMSIYDDSYIPGWKKLVDAVHQYDTKILSQLFHPAYMAFPIPGTPQLIAPSNVGPYSSVLLLYKGVKNPPNKPCAWAAWISTPSPPAFLKRKAASPNCLTITFNSSFVTSRGALLA